MLDFWDAQKRIYAKLTPLTPKIQAHDRVTEPGACQKQTPGFPILESAVFPVRPQSSAARKAARYALVPVCRICFAALRRISSGAAAIFTLHWAKKCGMIRLYLQDSYIGSTSASQAEEAGSTPVSCSKRKDTREGVFPFGLPRGKTQIFRSCRTFFLNNRID